MKKSPSSMSAGHHILHVGTLILLVMVLPVMAPAVTGNEIALEPSGIEVARRDAAAGTTLRWEWTATGVVAFSVSKSSDTSSSVYFTQGQQNASSLTVSSDSTYLLLWTNVGDQPVTLTYSVEVDAGTGPILVLFLVVILVIGILTIMFVLIARQDRRQRSRTPPPPGFQNVVSFRNQKPIRIPIHPFQRRRSTYPFALIRPILAGSTYLIGGVVNCPYCESPIPGNSRFCIFCLGKFA